MGQTEIAELFEFVNAPAVTVKVFGWLRAPADPIWGVEELETDES